MAASGSEGAAGKLPVATAIVLAGQREGVVNPLATRAGVSHKCLVPICGKPLILWVLEALRDGPELATIRVSVETDAHPALEQLLQHHLPDFPVELVTSAPNLVDSVFAACGDDAGPFLITTGDNVLLRPDAVRQVLHATTQAEAVFALARRDTIRAAHPEGQRNFYRFRDDAYANCNMYGLATRRALNAAEVFRSGGQFMKNRQRMVEAFGLGNILLMQLGLLTLASAGRRLSRRMGVRIEPTIFADGALAIDVDNERTYQVCEELLPQRKAVG